MKRTVAEMTDGNSTADQENKLLLKILPLEQAPLEKLTLATVGQFLENLCSARGVHDGLVFLGQAYKTSEDGMAVPSVWNGHTALREAIQTVALSQLLMASSSDKIRALTSVLDNGCYDKLVTPLLKAVADEADVRANLIITYSKKIKGRLLNRQLDTDFRILLRILRSDDKYKESLFSSPCVEEVWKPPFESKFIWKNKKGEISSQQQPGFFLQTESLLGWVFSPTCLDGALMPPSNSTATESGSAEWSKMRVGQAHIQQRQGTTQLKLVGAQKMMFDFVELLVGRGAGEDSRQAVLDWLGTMLTSAEMRGKQGYIMPEGFNFWPHFGNHPIDVLGHQQSHPLNQSLPNMLLMQVLHSRIQGVPTSGVALNMFAAMLSQCKKVADVSKAEAFSPYFGLREDIPGLLGNWTKEARFGDKDQVEKAKEIAKNDPSFSQPPAKKLGTVFFWLASKGVGVLLLPVAKEAFHAFQGMASVFYHKDQTNSDVAWREYLLAEAALKEPGFLDNLGHFLKMQFRFLCHAACGGKPPLPPPEPGPEWHALPSTMLDNVLDICDLYRDRDQRGKTNQLATGIYAMLELEPMLTTLCIVMASDSHVKDPSLRGRAVKLLHRLCFAFQHWQQKLNQPPLRDHLIPCLVGVFTGVEKAIMSYYDLAYRLKYELRSPVMELFDLTLQHDMHRKILHDFAKPGGVGHEKFLIMMTQLINDSNSQIDEAIRTLADFRSNKDKKDDAPVPSTGTQHDEQVEDDDQTGEGEDVYRRSRMNYKEHATKYFKLAKKTWHTLWLFCKHCPTTIVKGQSGTILEQLIHTSLDAQLYNLVGPKMKEIRLTPSEYEEMSFDPKDTVKKIAEIFLFLVAVSEDDVIHVISKDERFYSAQMFSKAKNFVRKYQLLPREDLDKFTSFHDVLIEKVSDTRAKYEKVDIPDRFLCEMMADIMSDPVMFPQSKKIVDRTTAWRTIAGSGRDPYANTELKSEDLVEQPELKAEIHRFAKDNEIPLEGGNLFD